MPDYSVSIGNGPIGRDLKKVRNVAPLNGRFGPLAGLVIGGFDMWFQSIFRFSILGTLKHGKSDAQSTEEAKDHKEILRLPLPFIVAK